MISAETLIGQLADSRWKLRERLDSTFATLIEDGEIQRVLALANSQDLADYENWIETYTAEANAETVTALKYVDGLIIGERTFSGRWRQAYTKLIRIDENPFIVQVLRKGYITTLMTSDVVPVFDWTEARVDTEDSRATTTPLERLRVRFPNVSPDNVEAVIDEIFALDVDGFEPVIRGEAYGTDFYRQFVTYRIEADGSATIILQVSKTQVTKSTYSQIGTEDEEAITNHWDVPPSLFNGIIENFKWTDNPTNTVENIGASAGASYDPREDLYDIILRAPAADASVSITDVLTQENCTWKTWTSFWWGLTEAEAIDATHSIPAVVDGNYSYTKSLGKQRGGKYMVTVKKRQALAGSRDITITLRAGVTETHHLAWGQLAATEPPVPAVGSEQRVSAIGRNDDCSWYWHTVESLIDEWSATLCFYYSDLTLNRRAWDTLLSVYVDQYLYKRFKHYIKEYATAAEAFTWANSSWIARGNPYRFVGARKHQGTQVTITLDQGWVDGDGYT